MRNSAACRTSARPLATSRMCGRLLTRHARERLAEQTGVQPHSAEALVCKRDGMERGADLLRRAAVVIQPFFLNNSFHGHNSYRRMTMRWRPRTPTLRLIFQMGQRRHPRFNCKRRVMDERMKGMDVAVLGMKRMDVAVLGGGPAGLAAALALRQRGCRVALYDGQRPPIDKACGEGLMPEAVRRLHGLGSGVGQRRRRSDDGHLLPRCTWERVCGLWQGAGLAVRRTRLQSRMAARAAEMGVEMHWGACVSAATDGGFASAGKAIRAEFFVIADGLCSTLAAASGFRERNCHSTRYASRQQFQCAPWSNHVEVLLGLA